MQDVASRGADREMIRSKSGLGTWGPRVVKQVGAVGRNVAAEDSFEGVKLKLGDDDVLECVGTGKGAGGSED